jgi:hypothetical protein
MQLKYKKTDKFEHPVFSTHGVPNAAKTQKKLSNMATKLDVAEYNPIWVSPEHGTCLVTCRNKDLSDLIEGAIYEVKLSARIVDGKFANVWVNKLKLKSKPDLGELVEFDDSEDEEE